MRLCETFRSIQGELQGIGRQCFFVRTYGCNLGASCSVDCDTRYAWDAASGNGAFDLSNVEIGAMIKASGVAAVVITGGEPLLQQGEIVSLIRQVPDIDWYIETNGTIVPLEALYNDEHVFFNVSPKVVEFDPAPFPLDRSVFKVVVTPGTSDLLAWEKRVAALPVAIMRRTFFMPASRTRDQYIINAPAVAAWCNEHGYNFGPREHMVAFQGRRGL